MTATDPRQSAAYVRLRRQWRAALTTDVCCLCGGRVDLTASGNAPHGPTVEHTIDVVDRPDLALDTTWWALAHRACNQRKGASLGGRRLAARKRGITPPADSPLVRYTPSRAW